MIFDIYEQADLFKIAKCCWKSKLEEWLKDRRIPFSHDSKGNIIAHKKAVEAGLGVELPQQQKEETPALWLGDDNAA